MKSFQQIMAENHLQFQEVEPGVYKILSQDTLADIDVLKVQFGKSIFLYSDTVQYVLNKQGYYDRKSHLYYILTDIKNYEALVSCRDELQKLYGSFRTYHWDPYIEGVGSFDPVFGSI